MIPLDPIAVSVPVEGMISVVMPCFNAASFLRQAVESALGQSYTNLELIVVDDGSTDSSREILRGYTNRVKVIAQKNRGPCFARNRGAAVSRGEYIAFLDADDYWSRGCLAELHDALQGSDAALAYCGWQNVGLADARGKPYIPPDYEAGDKLEAFLRSAAPWPIHAALLRKSAWNEVGGFSEYPETCEDYDLWLRLALSRPIRRVEKVMAFYRHHDHGNISALRWRSARDTWLVKKKFIRENPAAREKLGRKRLKELIDGGLLRRGFDAYWRRDLVSARRIFRTALRAGGWTPKHLRYLLPALLPERAYLALIARLDSGAARGA